MVKTAVIPVLEITEIDLCIHHEFIDENLIGTCKKCGRKKDYKALQSNLLFPIYELPWSMWGLDHAFKQHKYYGKQRKL